jgi:DNA-binding MarR family transcriptional regulator
MRSDYIDSSIEAWQSERPDLDVGSVAVIGRIRRAAALIDERIAAVIARFGIRNPGDFDTLATLRREGEPFQLSPKELTSRLLLTSAGLSGRLDRLEGPGWIERSPHPDDGRATIVTLTPDGVAIVDEVHRHILDEYRDALGPIDRTSRDGLADLLRNILVNLGDA